MHTCPGEIEERSMAIGKYICDTGATVRAAAAVFGISKSTVHKDVSERLKGFCPALWEEVALILEENKAERHLRGGEATRIKYQKEKEARN
ncbi:MAG: sporulation transcriptional regulator SpoIIID [Clostridia bacterium]|nr:sporulation transcriptional regulator SpoIIID [Clostridia bacterium]